MNLETFSAGGSVFTHSECILGFSFTLDAARVRSAFLQEVTAFMAEVFARVLRCCVHFDTGDSLLPDSAAA